MDEATYPYASGDLIKKRNTYFYTPFRGPAFLAAWKEDRDSRLSRLGPPQPAPSPIATSAPRSGEPIETERLLEFLMERLAGGLAQEQEIREWLEMIL
jgi:hypothetical protein